MPEQPTIHPQIQRLIESDLSIETEGQDSNTEIYTRGWIAGMAMKHYSCLLAEFLGGKEPVSAVVDKLCAEIGYWWAIADMHRSKEGKKRERIRTSA